MQPALTPRLRLRRLQRWNRLVHPEPATAVPAPVAETPQHQSDEAGTEAASEHKPPRTADSSPAKDRPAPVTDPKVILLAPAFAAGNLPTLFLNPWEQEEEGSDPTFTEQDAQDFPRLRMVARSSQEEFIAAKLEIYNRQLWRQLRKNRRQPPIQILEPVCRRGIG